MNKEATAVAEIKGPYMSDFPSFTKIISDHAAHTPNTAAIVDLASHQTWTWEALDTDVERLTLWLAEQYEPASQNRIVALSKNRVELLILQHACARAGLIYTPLNWRLSPAEIGKLLSDCEPKLIFADPDLNSDSFGFETRSIETCLDLEASNPETVSPTPAPLNAPLTILYTSGTSGHPKGVLLSSDNVGAGADNFISPNAVTRDSVFLCDMPLFHTAGLFALAAVAIQAGSTLLLSQGFDPKESLTNLSNPDLGVTHYFTVPQMAQMLRNHPDFSAKSLSSLVVYATGGAPNPPSQIRHFVENGILMSDGYGMSEICSTMGMPFDDPEIIKQKAGSCGKLYAHSEARIVDGHGVDVPPGESGELWIKSPTVTKGYWNQPELSAVAFKNGWFKTGDIARCDPDGFYYLVDRKKDMFISGGENVYPAQVENVIAELSAIAQAAVVGVADEKWGEVGRAYVAPVKGKSTTEAEVISHCKTKLAGFKVPKSVVILDELPSTGSGKVQKHLLPRG